MQKLQYFHGFLQENYSQQTTSFAADITQMSTLIGVGATDVKGLWFKNNHHQFVWVMLAVKPKGETVYWVRDVKHSTAQVLSDEKSAIIDQQLDSIAQTDAQVALVKDEEVDYHVYKKIKDINHQLSMVEPRRQQTLMPWVVTLLQADSTNDQNYIFQILAKTKSAKQKGQWFSWLRSSPLLTWLVGHAKVQAIGAKNRKLITWHAAFNNLAWHVFQARVSVFGYPRDDLQRWHNQKPYLKIGFGLLVFAILDCLPWFVYGLSSAMTSGLMFAAMATLITVAVYTWVVFSQPWPELPELSDYHQRAIKLVSSAELKQRHEHVSWLSLSNVKHGITSLKGWWQNKRTSFHHLSLFSRSGTSQVSRSGLNA